MQNVYGVIMAGGVGKRFRPLSSPQRPKQFLDILGTGRTFLQQTYDRLTQFIPPTNIMVVTSAQYRSFVEEQLPDMPKDAILCEPLRRNTAPCIAYAAYRLRSINPQAAMIVTPSDHLVLRQAEFEQTLRSAVRYAQTGDKLVTIGIKPSRAETGYGYIQVSEGAGSGEELGICKVKTFTEKPSQELAQVFIDSGEFYWNSGMFIWSVQSICRALEEYMPEMAKLFAAGSDCYGSAKEEDFIAKTYSDCKAISIDYGVMEKADNAYVICANLGWSDLGSWTSLYLNLEKDADGNAVSDSGVSLCDVKNCLIKTPADKLVVIHGLSDFVVAAAADVLMICPRSQAEEVAQAVDTLQLEREILVKN